jgi:hypothetical protein
MKVAKNFMLRIFGAFVLFFFCTGTGYVYRTWECRSDLQTIYIAAPGYQHQGGLPSKLYEVSVTRCTLPAQWGGQRDALRGYP